MKTKAHISDPSKVAGQMFSKTTVRHSEVERKRLKKVDLVSKEVTVFLVDDDNLFLRALEHTITEKHPSVAVRTFQSGEACLEEIKLKPAVVVLDFYMNSTNKGALDGLSVLKRIKKVSPKTKVIMLSSQDSLNMAMECINNGSYDYITKSESAIVKLNNTLSNIVDEIKLNERFLKPYQVILLIFFIVLLLSHFLN